MRVVVRESAATLPCPGPPCRMRARRIDGRRPMHSRSVALPERLCDERPHPGPRCEQSKPQQNLPSTCRSKPGRMKSAGIPSISEAQRMTCRSHASAHDRGHRSWRSARPPAYPPASRWRFHHHAPTRGIWDDGCQRRRARSVLDMTYIRRLPRRLDGAGRPSGFAHVAGHRPPDRLLPDAGHVVENIVEHPVGQSAQLRPVGRVERCICQSRQRVERMHQR